MRITTGHIVPSARPAPLAPAQVAREFRAHLAGGAAIKAVGGARDDPRVLLTRAYLPRFRLSLFDTTYYLSAVRQDPQIRFFVAHVMQTPTGRRARTIHPRIFYKDVSLVWRSASHLVRSDNEHWIGKGEVRAIFSNGHEYLVSAEETTNLPLEIQSALETLMVRSQRVVTDSRAVALVLRQGGAQRIAPFHDFTGPRERARADPRNLINGGRRIARFTRRGDPTSLVFTRGFEPDFAAGFLELSRFRSRLYGGRVTRCRILSRNAQVQYLFFAAPRHAWVGACQPTTTDLTSYGVRSIDAWVEEDLLMPGYEYHLADERGKVAEVTRQVPANFVGTPSPVDPNRVDTSAWLEQVPVLRSFRRALARA
jgi:hypothetical protein